MLLGSAVVFVDLGQVREAQAEEAHRQSNKEGHYAAIYSRNPGVVLVVWWSEMCVSRWCESAKRCLRFA
jgi:hypothetical protein